MPTASKPILMAEFGRAVGLKGEVRLKIYLEDLSRLCDYNPYTDEHGQTYVIVSARPQPGAPDICVVRVEGVADRTAAEALNRKALFIPRDRLGDVSDSNIYFQADLIGLDVRDSHGTCVGRIIDVANFGAGDILDIKPLKGGASVMVAFQDAFITTLDIQNGYVTITDAKLLEETLEDPHETNATKRFSAASDRRALNRKRSDIP